MGANTLVLAEDAKQALSKYADTHRAKNSQRFFKTGKGEYGEGDIFLGVSVPHQRIVAKKFSTMPLAEISKLLHSPVHEHRLTAVIILVGQFKQADEPTQKTIYDFYLHNTRSINNWDIVDTSAGAIVGEYLWQKDDANKILSQLAKSTSIWERRIAIIATFAFIYHGNSQMTFDIAQILLHDEHDLIQKAVGWMLREAGKRISMPGLESFLASRYQTMPRTMLRYTIERFEEPIRQKYLSGRV